MRELYFSSCRRYVIPIQSLEKDVIYFSLLRVKTAYLPNSAFKISVLDACRFKW
jgi:hypothetical protein